MFTLTVYFNGPKTEWSGKVAGDEIIAEHEVPFLFLARFKARAILRELNKDRCGYVITKDGKPIEPTTPEVKPKIAARGATAELVAALPEILKRNNDALEAKIVAKLSRRQYTP